MIFKLNEILTEAQTKEVKKIMDTKFDETTEIDEEVYSEYLTLIYKENT